MSITALTVCVNYEDYLLKTLPINRHHFSHYYIITSFSEKLKLKSLLQPYDVIIFPTLSFYVAGASFNKGRAINDVLQKIKRKKGWVCHLDADILLPQTIVTENLNKDTLYGCPRRMCPSADEYKLYLQNSTRAKTWPIEQPGFNKKSKKIAKASSIRDHLKAHPEDKDNFELAFPIGYIQLFYNTPLSPSYPCDALYAGTSDIDFAKKWEKYKYLNFEVTHLPLLGNRGNGQNWWGRTSPEFMVK